MNKLLLILVLLVPIIHYDDEDGHREPWNEWRETACVTEPIIIMDSSYNDPTCNPNTGKGVTVWMCHTGGDIYKHSSTVFYTTHWFCGVIGEAISRYSYYLPFVISPK